VVMIQTDASGGSVEIPIDKYLESLDSEIATIKSQNIRLLTTKVTETKDDILAESKKELSALVVGGVDASDDDMDVAIDKAISAVKSYFNTDDVDPKVLDKLSKMKAFEVINIFPDEFIELFSEKSYRHTNPMKVKEDILVAFGYCIMVGPEMDKLNDEIEHKNRMIDLLVRMNDASISHAEMIQSEESVKDLFTKILSETNELNDKYRKYVKTPDAINNIYSQKKHTLISLNAEYCKLRDTLILADEIAEIDKEINSNQAMIDIYGNILSLSRFIATIDSIVNAHKKGISMRDLHAKSFTSFDSFGKISVPITLPNYNGNEANIKVIYNNYLNYFKNLIPVYNNVVKVARDNGDCDLDFIDVTGDIFAECIIVVLGRIVKILGKKDAVSSLTEINVTFDMICRLGTELFMLDKINKTLKPMYELIK